MSEKDNEYIFIYSLTLSLVLKTLLYTDVLDLALLLLLFYVKFEFLNILLTSSVLYLLTTNYYLILLNLDLNN